jgi:hypothetical protein
MNAKDSRQYLGSPVAMLWIVAAAIAAPALAANTPARTQPPSYGAGTLSLANGNYQFAPEGCMHNGNRAICNFYITYTGAQQGNVNAWAGYYAQWTMNVQLVDNLHVPHAPDTAYFIDATGAHQPVMFIQQGTQVWIAVEFPNVDGSVTNGEFHMGNQIVGGVLVSQPNMPSAPASTAQYAMNQTQAPMVPQATAPAAVPAAAGAPPNCTPGTPGYSGAALCNVNDKMNAVKSWGSLLSGFVPAKTSAAPQPAMQPPQMQPPQMQPPQMQPPQMQPPQMQPPQMQPPQAQPVTAH